MPTQRLALMGAAHGPWASIKGLREPVLKVAGFREGQIEVEMMCKGCTIPLLTSIDRGGETPLRELSSAFVDAGVEWIRLTASHPSSDLICIVVSQKAA